MPEASEPPRMNRRGDPCPGWCTQDHDGEYSLDHHHGDVTLIHLSGSPAQQAAKRAFGPEMASGRHAAAGVVMFDRDAYQREEGEPPSLRVEIRGASARWATGVGQVRLWTEAGTAAGIADLLDVLAYATPSQMQRLARGIRDAITVAASETEARESHTPPSSPALQPEER